MTESMYCSNKTFPLCWFSIEHDVCILSRLNIISNTKDLINCGTLKHNISTFENPPG